jgi:hypothetical protein
MRWELRFFAAIGVTGIVGQACRLPFQELATGSGSPTNITITRAIPAILNF